MYLCMSMAYFLLENMDEIKEVKKQLSSKLYMKDLSIAKFIMGMKIKEDRATRKP